MPESDAPPPNDSTPPPLDAPDRQVLAARQPVHWPDLAPTTVRLLERTQPWVRLLAILGFITVALMITIGLAIGVAGMVTGNLELIVLMIVYPMMSAIYLLPVMYLMRYASCIRAIAGEPSTASLDAALDAQRSFWKTVGILALVFAALTVVFAVLGFLAGLLIPLLERS